MAYKKPTPQGTYNPVGESSHPASAGGDFSFSVTARPPKPVEVIPNNIKQSRKPPTDGIQKSIVSGHPTPAGTSVSESSIHPRSAGLEVNVKKSGHPSPAGTVVSRSSKKPTPAGTLVSETSSHPSSAGLDNRNISTNPIKPLIPADAIQPNNIKESKHPPTRGIQKLIDSLNPEPAGTTVSRISAKPTQAGSNGFASGHPTAAGTNVKLKSLKSIGNYGVAKDDLLRTPQSSANVKIRSAGQIIPKLPASIAGLVPGLSKTLGGISTLVKDVTSIGNAFKGLGGGALSKDPLGSIGNALDALDNLSAVMKRFGPKKRPRKLSRWEMEINSDHPPTLGAWTIAGLPEQPPGSNLKNPKIVDKQWKPAKIPPQPENFGAKNITSKNALARASKFLVTFPSLPKSMSAEWNAYLTNFSFRCEAAEFPGKTLNTIDTKIYGTAYKTPINTLFNEVNLTMLCSSNLLEKSFFDGWIFAINPFGAKNKRFDFKYRDDYIVDNVQISQYDDLGNESYRCYLKDAYPTSVQSIPLSWGDDQFTKIQVTLTYMYYFNETDLPDPKYASHSAKNFIAQGKPSAPAPSPTN